MSCHLVSSETITKIPVVTESGQHNNIYTKEFKLLNTTGKDVASFRIIFEFDADAKIIKYDTFCKTGKNEIKPKIKKPNEVSYVIKNFNRLDDYRFYFDIANVTNDYFNVTEADCIGFKIEVKVGKIASSKIKSQVVTKDKIS